MREGLYSVLWRGMARHGRWRWALLLRRGAMMPEPAARTNRSFCDGLRFRATSRRLAISQDRPLPLR